MLRRSPVQRVTNSHVHKFQAANLNETSGWVETETVHWE